MARPSRALHLRTHIQVIALRSITRVASQQPYKRIAVAGYTTNIGDLKEATLKKLIYARTYQCVHCRIMTIWVQRVHRSVICQPASTLEVQFVFVSIHGKNRPNGHIKRCKIRQGRPLCFDQAPIRKNRNKVGNNIRLHVSPDNLLIKITSSGTW